MSELGKAGLGQRLKIGSTVSIRGKSKQALAATVTKISADEVSLELAKPTPQPSFQQGEPAEIKYWEEGYGVYFWDAEVITISGQGNEHVTISAGKEATVEWRRFYKVRSPVRLSFTIIEAAESELIGAKVVNSETQDIRVGGLAFETSLALKEGDKLELDLHLPSSQEVTAVGWVVQSEPVQSERRSLNSVALKFPQLEAKEQRRLLRFLLSSPMGE